MYNVQASEGKPGTELVGGATGAWNTSLIPYYLLLLVSLYSIVPLTFNSISYLQYGNSNVMLTCTFFYEHNSPSDIDIVVGREFEEVNTQQREAGGWRVLAAGPALGCLFCFCFCLLFVCFYLNDWFQLNPQEILCRASCEWNPLQCEGIQGLCKALQCTGFSEQHVCNFFYDQKVIFSLVFTCLMVSGSRRWGRLFEHNGQRRGGGR